MKKDQPRFQNWLNVLSCGSWLHSYRQGCLSRVAVVLFPDTCAASQREQQERHHNRLPIKHHMTALTTTELHLKLNSTKMIPCILAGKRCYLWTHGSVFCRRTFPIVTAGPLLESESAVLRLSGNELSPPRVCSSPTHKYINRTTT